MHSWGPEIHDGIYDMLHLLLDLIVARLKYKPVPFGLLDLLTQVLYLPNLIKVAAFEINNMSNVKHTQQ